MGGQLLAAPEGEILAVAQQPNVPVLGSLVLHLVGHIAVTTVRGIQHGLQLA